MIFDFHLTSVTPLIVHADDVELADRLKEWRQASENRNKSVAGDDRSPAWTWKTYLYSDGEYLTLPSDNLMVALRSAGASMILKKQTTYKSITQSGLAIMTEHLPLLVNGKPIKSADVEAIDGEFKDHTEAAKKLGFRLFVKRARVGNAKHVRVRPRFDEWSIKGQIEVLTTDISEDALRQLFDIAGKYKGACDWRPSSPKSPGPFGRFNAVLKAA